MRIVILVFALALLLGCSKKNLEPDRLIKRITLKGLTNGQVVYNGEVYHLYPEIVGEAKTVYYYNDGYMMAHSEVIHDQGYYWKPEGYSPGEYTISIEGIDRMQYKAGDRVKVNVKNR